ncbi:hypothetical protein REO92_004729 [Citrobacter freundii]|uniref:hypothetical protein n=1 Tax=Citrobacter freundii TaxID=546 RepID=UPI001A21F40F|nr:hypothetical protein [Citrobacter freundii]EKT9263902.1 hypothetical protein [Citrobacter freundii]EKW0769035.1 hypothetical protein [Citrobacter freundii]EKZ3398043.1 hypothetical protein [Citrobacter freundii]EKZ3406451.1 hypothetical protein [Citrobacter freundii]MCO4106802.1 hypothetical protein [Citrobacter freundii]
MKKNILLAVVISAVALSAHAKENKYTANFVNEVKSAADGNGQLSEKIIIECPAPSASGTFLITKATYDFSGNLGSYTFKNGQGPDAKLSWIGAKFKGDDLLSDEVVGFDFGFTMPHGQFFITVMKNGVVKAGINKNGTSGIQEIICKAVIPG